MNKKIGMLLVLAALYSTQSMALVCAILPDDGKSYPIDKEAKDLLAALKPATNCDGKQVMAAEKILGKKIVKRVATEQEQTAIRTANAARAELRVQKRLIKAGLKK